MNSGRLSRTARPYNNALREEQAKQTRLKILETAVELLQEGSGDGLSVPRIAERSQISVATIYRHFPDRDALLDGVDAHIGERLGRPPFPDVLEELIAGAPALFRYYDNAWDLMRLAHETGALRELHVSRRKDRDRRIAAMTATVMEGVEPRRANAISALLRTLYGFDAYQLMRERFGVTADEASEAVAWAARTLIAKLEKERAGKGRTRPETRRSKKGQDGR